MLVLLAKLRNVCCKTVSSVIAGQLGVVSEGVALEQGRVAVVATIGWRSQQLV